MESSSRRSSSGSCGWQEEKAAITPAAEFFLKRFVGKSKKLEVVDPATGRLNYPRRLREAGYYTGRLGENMEPLALVEVSTKRSRRPPPTRSGS